MREVPALMSAVWQSGAYVGDHRPMARVTVQRPQVILHQIMTNMLTSIFWGRFDRFELPNVKSVRWDRSIDSDVANCTIEFYNVAPLPLGETPTQELDQRGYYTYNRGRSSFASRWGHVENEWARRIMPDNFLRTYEGYGFDPEAAPEEDPHLVQTGVWRIDDVEFTHDGLIVVSCRDVGSLLLDHLMFPPVVPERAGFVTPEMPHGAYAYPLSFRSRNTEPVVHGVPASEAGQLAVRYHSNSNQPYVGHGSVYGHSPQDAFDGDDSSYWLSIGNARPDQGYSFEWIQGQIKNQRVRRVRFRTKGSGYTAYLGLYGTSWQGSNVVPYDPNHPASAPNGSDERYVMAIPVTSEGWHEFVLPDDGIANVRYIRITLGGLWNSGLGEFRYRAAVRRFEVYGGAATQTQTFQDKNYDDYTDIVKLLLGWGGWYWPHNATEWFSNDVERTWPTDADPAMTIYVAGGGRIWGDFELSGTAGPAELGVEIWDKKPLMEGINYVREILGFLFYIDELGGAVFRHPNIFQVGNLMRTGSARSGVRVRQHVTIDERTTLIGLRSKLSGRNVRERIWVSNTNGRFAAAVRGWNPNRRIGLRRVSGWTDQNFENVEECMMMAEMIALRQLLTYRTDTVTIPGYPAIQVDDQVRIFEAVTSEGYLHYVKGITSSLDLESGEWTYELQTNWLGERPFDRWLFNPIELSDTTQRKIFGGTPP